MEIFITDYNKNVDDFEKYINEHYIADGQVIQYLDVLYSNILKLTIIEQHYIWQTISIENQRELETKYTQLTRNDMIFLRTITQSIRVQNGDSSELWVAIFTSGKVCGGVNVNNYESDVNIGNVDISVKRYNTMFGICMGAISPDFSIYFRKFIQLCSILSDVNILSSYGRNGINELMQKLNTLNIEEQITELKSNGSHNEFPILEKLVNECGDLYTEELSIVDMFKETFNSAIYDKIYSVDWWCFIVKNRMIMIDSQTLYESLRMEGNYIKETFKDFRSLKLNINVKRILEYV